MNNLPGGFRTELNKPTDNENEILYNLKESIETELGQQFNQFELVDFTTQIVAGVIYLMRVRVDEDEFLHVKIIKPLPYTNLPPSIMNVRRGFTIDSPLQP